MNITYNTTVARPSSFIIAYNPPFIVILYRYGLSFVLVLGFIGNLSSITTFMRPILRSTSTGCLFLMVAVSDTLFLLVTIFDFVEVGIVEGPIFLSEYDNFCRFRWFSKGFIRFCSAWILVFVAIDRWIRARMPFRTKQLCTCRNVFIVTSFIIIIGVGFHSFMLNPTLLSRFFPGIPSLACGPGNTNGAYLYFFFIYWPVIQVSFICVIPIIINLASGIRIHYTLKQERGRIQPIMAGNRRQTRKSRLQRHMLLLTITSIVLFCVTTLPISIRQIITSCLIAVGITGGVNDSVIQEAVLTLLLSLNYAINFYIHCLASRLFRDEFVQSIKGIYHLRRLTMLQNTTRVGGTDGALTTNHPVPMELNYIQSHNEH